MMDDVAAVGAYFERKAARWTSTEGSVAAHVRRVGRDGLIAEFRSDGDFNDVCRYLHRMSDVQYVHDTAYSEFKAQVRESIFGGSGDVWGARREVGVIIRAAMMACRVAPAGERLVRIVGALPRQG
jgi:hypothetical protein